MKTDLLVTRPGWGKVQLSQKKIKKTAFTFLLGAWSRKLFWFVFLWIALITVLRQLLTHARACHVNKRWQRSRFQAMPCRKQTGIVLNNPINVFPKFCSGVIARWTSNSEGCSWARAQMAEEIWQKLWYADGNAGSWFFCWLPRSLIVPPPEEFNADNNLPEGGVGAITSF